MREHKKGFTLAEVLITLGIIGVVAAISIPGLITKYQKLVTVVKLKKVYSQLNQVMRYINEDPGIDVISGSPSVYVGNYILPHYAGATFYPRPVNGGNRNVMCYDPATAYFGAKYASAQYAWINTRTGKSSGYISTPFMGSEASIKLQDGTCIAFGIGYGNMGATIFVDINGSDVPPNRAGRDLFFFTLDKEKGSVIPTTAPSGGVDWSKFGAKKIIDDGWRINRDYAWK